VKLSERFQCKGGNLLGARAKGRSSSAKFDFLGGGQGEKSRWERLKTGGGVGELVDVVAGKKKEKGGGLPSA